MKILLISNRTKHIKAHQIIIDWLKRQKYQIKSELIKNDKLPKVINFDVVILEVEENNKIIGKLIFKSLMQNKLILLLYKYHSGRPKNLDFPLEKKMLKFLTIKGYVVSQLPQVLEKFFLDLEKGEAERFNFFISKDIDDYLNWIPYSQAKSKSDFIRGLIRDKMEKDGKYNNQKSKSK